MAEVGRLNMRPKCSQLGCGKGRWRHITLRHTMEDPARLKTALGLEVLRATGQALGVVPAAAGNRKRYIASPPHAQPQGLDFPQAGTSLGGGYHPGPGRGPDPGGRSRGG